MYFVVKNILPIFCICQLAYGRFVEELVSDDKFMYFAYGSNLLARRLHIKNPSAIFHGTAKLENYRLDFNIYSERWNGAAATIVEDHLETVWGDLWILDKNQMGYLDEQEGVEDGMYFPKNVTVVTPEGQLILARTYQETLNPPKLAEEEILPLERRPSNTYLEVIILGAIESGLPPDYIGVLFSIPTNRRIASEKLRHQLGYPFSV